MTEAETTVSETSRVLYGDATGRWLLVTGELDVIPPPTIDVGVPHQGTFELTYLGDLAEVVTRLITRKQGRGAIQQAIADLLGVSQQSVSRYAAGLSTPAMDEYPTLVRACFDPAVVDQALRSVTDPDPILDADPPRSAPGGGEG